MKGGNEMANDRDGYLNRMIEVPCKRGVTHVPQENVTSQINKAVNQNNTQNQNTSGNKDEKK